MEELRAAAKACYFENPVFNRTIQEINRRIDIEFDNEVNYQTFVTMVEERSRRCTSRSLFRLLDRGRKDHLDQDDVRVLYYLMHTRGDCSHCGDILRSVYYTCLLCFDNCNSPNNPAFNVCATCYSAKAFNHPQHNDFVDNYELLQRRRFQQWKWEELRRKDLVLLSRSTKWFIWCQGEDLQESAVKSGASRFLSGAIGEGCDEREAIAEQLDGLREMAGEHLNQAAGAVSGDHSLDPIYNSGQVTIPDAGNDALDTLGDIIEIIGSIFT